MGTRISVGRAQLTRALAGYRESGLLDNAGEEAIEWFWGYATEHLNLDRDRMAEALEYDATTVHNALAGNRTASLGPMVERIELMRKRVAGRESKLIETPVTRRICEALEYAKNSGSMVVIRGETGRGKTFTVKEWARANNHGRSVYVRCQSGCTKGKLVRQIAEAIGVGTSGKRTSDIEAQVEKGFDRRRTLIVDEAGHMVPTHGRSGRDMLDLLRDIHDMCESGVVFVFTSVYWDEIQTGRMAPFFEQFIGRIGYNLHIPEGHLFREEIAAIVRAHGFDDDALPLAAEIAKEEGKLRVLFRDLANARVFAKSSGGKLDGKMLKGARAWRHSGGARKEDTI